MADNNIKLTREDEGYVVVEWVHSAVGKTGEPARFVRDTVQVPRKQPGERGSLTGYLRDGTVVVIPFCCGFAIVARHLCWSLQKVDSGRG